MSMYWIIFIGFALLSWLVSSRLKNKFEKYSKIPMPNGMTGKDVAEKMLRDNGIYDVKVISTPGHLTDHYNPANQTVNLSESVYYSNSIAAAAVAAHECGHAVQHATSYAPLKMRSALVPVVSFASNIMTWVLLGGMLLIHQFPQLLLFGIILFASTTLFSFITLPVEINASACVGMVESCRDNECLYAWYGRRCFALCRLYLCGGCLRFAGYIIILYNDLPGRKKPRLSEYRIR